MEATCAKVSVAKEKTIVEQLPAVEQSDIVEHVKQSYVEQKAESANNMQFVKLT